MLSKEASGIILRHSDNSLLLHETREEIREKRREEEASEDRAWRQKSSAEKESEKDWVHLQL